MTTITIDQAIKTARVHVEELARAAGDSFELLPGEIMEVSEGWIFYFNTSDFIQSGNPSDALAGNGPLLVLRDGQIRELSASLSLEDALKKI